MNILEALASRSPSDIRSPGSFPVETLAMQFTVRKRAEPAVHMISAESTEPVEGAGARSRNDSLINKRLLVKLISLRILYLGIRLRQLPNFVMTKFSSLVEK